VAGRPRADASNIRNYDLRHGTDLLRISSTSASDFAADMAAADETTALVDDARCRCRSD
jgi:hypothetical protein